MSERLFSVTEESITDVFIAAANKDGAVDVPSMRTLGTGALQAAAGDHSHGSGLADADYGDVVVSGSGAVMTVESVGGVAFGTAATTAAADYQPVDDTLTSLALLGTAADKLAYTTGVDTWAEAALTAAGRAILDDAAAADQLTTLGAAAAAITISTTAPLSGGGDLTANRTLVWTDPWTYVRVTTTFATTNATPTNVITDGGSALLKVTPAASTLYEIEGFFLMRTSLATCGPRAGCAWPTGYADGAAAMSAAVTATQNTVANAPAGTAIAMAGVASVPNATESWPVTLKTTLLMGASPSGNFQITLQSETAGQSVSMQAGSWLRYRAVP